MNMQQMKDKKYYLNGDSGSSTEPSQSLQICSLLDPQFLCSVKSSKRCITLSQQWKSHHNNIDLDISSVNDETSFYSSELKESEIELGKHSSSWPGHKKLLESSLKSLSQPQRSFRNIMSKTLSFERGIKERENETEEKSKPEDDKTISLAETDLDISSVNEDTSFYSSELKESEVELGKHSSSWPGHKKLFESSLKSLSQPQRSFRNIMSKTLSFERGIKERENETEEKSKPEDDKTISLAEAGLKIIDAYEEARLHDEISAPEVALHKYSSSWPEPNKTVQYTFKNLSQPEMPSSKNIMEKSRVFPISVESITGMHLNPSQNNDADIFSTSGDTCSEDDYDSELGLSLCEPASWPGFSNSYEEKKLCFRSSSQPVIQTNRSNNTNDNLPLKLNKNDGHDKSQEVLDKKDNANVLHQSSDITDTPHEDPDIYHDKVVEKRTGTHEQEDECHFKQLDIRKITIVPSGLYTAGQEILPSNSETVSSNKKVINSCEFSSTSTDHLSNVNDVPVAEDVNTSSLKDMFLGNPMERIMDNDGDTDSQTVPCLSPELNNKLQNNTITEMEELNVSCSNHQTDFVHNIDVMEVLHDLWASSNEKESAHLESLQPKLKMNDCSANKENKYTSENDQGNDSSLNSSVEETEHRNQPNPVLDINTSTPESYKEACYKGIQNVSEDFSVADLELRDAVHSLVDQEAPDISPTKDCVLPENSTSSLTKSEHLEDMLYTEIDKAFAKYEEKMANEMEDYQELSRNSLMTEVAVQTEITNLNIFHQCKCTEYNMCNKTSIPLKHTKNISFDEIEAKIALKRSMQALCLEIPTLKRIRLYREVNVNIQVGKKEEMFQRECDQKKEIQQRTPNITYNCGFKNNTTGSNGEGEEGEKEEEVCELLSTSMNLNSFTNSQIKEKDQEVPRASGKYLQTNNFNSLTPEYFSLSSTFPWQNSLITNSAKIDNAEELMKEEEEHSQDSLSSHPAPRLRLGLSKRAKPRRLHIYKNYHNL